MANIYEHWEYESGKGTAKGDGNSRTLRYTITGTNEYSVAEALLESTFPATHDSLDAQDYSLNKLGDDLFVATVNYGTRITQSQRWSFDTTGNSVRITHGLSEFRYGAAGLDDSTVPAMDGALNVQDGNVQGYDKVIPGMKFTITNNYPEALVTDEYIETLENLTGTVNRDPFAGRAAESLLFLGATGSKGSSGDPEISHHYVAGRHAANFQIGSISGINKKAHQFVWVLWGEIPDAVAKKLRKVARGVYVNDVNEIADWDDIYPS